MSNRVEPDEEELRVVVVGREGHGKSTVCNALLGTDRFTVGTQTESSDIDQCSKNGLNIKVVDTPDVSNNNMKQKEKKAEVAKWKELAAPYPSVLLLVIKGDAPYSEQDFIAYRQVRRFWGGKDSTKGRLVVAFTFCQGQDVNEVGDRMEKDSPKWMGKILKDSGGRFLVFKGKSAGNFLDEVMIDDSDDEEEEEDDKGSDDEGKKGGKGKKKVLIKFKARGGHGRRGCHGKHGKRGRRGSKGSHGSHGRRGSHGSGKGKKRTGIWRLLCCCCNLIG